MKTLISLPANPLALRPGIPCSENGHQEKEGGRRDICSVWPGGAQHGLQCESLLFASGGSPVPSISIWYVDAHDLCNSVQILEYLIPLQSKVDEEFTIHVQLFDTQLQTVKTGLSFDLTIKALFINGEGCPPGVVELCGEKPRLQTNGIGSIQVRIRKANSELVSDLEELEDRPIAIRVIAQFDMNSLAADDPLRLLGYVQPVDTYELRAVRYRLELIEQPPVEFYKDEGGRDKCMQVRVQLQDADHRPFLGRELPLNIELLYHRTELPVKQPSRQSNILRLMQDRLPIIDSTGHCDIRFRIEEVSKNHDRSTHRY